MGMRGSAIACLVASLLTASCTTRQRVAGGGAGLAVVGLGLTFSNETRSEDDAESAQGKIGIACMLTGLVVLFVAAALDESSKEEETKPVEIKAAQPATLAEPTVADVAQKKREDAWALTKQAQASARDGDCAKVIELSAQVGALDRDFYADVFMKDVAVQHCFVPASVPADAPPVPATSPQPTTP